MQVFLDESHRKHFGAALKKTSSGGSENMEKTDFCTSPIVIALIWILCCLFVLATMSVKHRSTCCAFLTRPFLTVTRQPTFWRTWSQTRPMMCLSPPSIRTNQRARICSALRGHVRCTTQPLCDDNWTVTIATLFCLSCSTESLLDLGHRLE